jgi:hypothetical protein
MKHNHLKDESMQLTFFAMLIDLISMMKLTSQMRH